MWETIYSGEEVEIDIVKGEDFEQTWIISDENNVPIPFVTQGYSGIAFLGDRTGVWNEEMTLTLGDDGSAKVFLGKDKTLLDKIKVGSHIWTLALDEPGTGYRNVIFNPPARIHQGALKS